MFGSDAFGRIDSIVLVTSCEPSIRHWGTAFVVDRDEKYTYFLTCAHVVEKVGGKGNVSIAGQKADVESYRDDIDAAVLKIAKFPTSPVIPLRVKSKAGGGFSTTGFLQFGTQFKKQSLQGKFGTYSSLHTRDKLNGHIAWELRPDGSETFEPGLSGSPVFCETGECVAMAAFKQGALGIALSIELIRDVWPKAIFVDQDEEKVSAVQKRDPRMNREDEIDAFARVMSMKDPVTKVLIIVGPSGMGKTQLLTEYGEIAGRYGWEVMPKTFKEQITVDGFLLSIATRFGGRSNCPTFYNYRAQPRSRSVPDKEHFRVMVQHFCNDLSRLANKPPVLLLIDDYEKGDELLK